MWQVWRTFQLGKSNQKPRNQNTQRRGVQPPTIPTTLATLLCGGPGALYEVECSAQKRRIEDKHLGMDELDIILWSKLATDRYKFGVSLRLWYLIFVYIYILYTYYLHDEYHIHFMCESMWCLSGLFAPLWVLVAGWKRAECIVWLPVLGSTCKSALLWIIIAYPDNSIRYFMWETFELRSFMK